MKFYEQGREKGGFESGIRLAVQSILMSPRFLFRLEQQPARHRAAGATYRIADEDLASRLSFFLWGTVPDAELVRAASLGSLQDRGRAREAGAPHARRSRGPKRCRRASRRSGCGCRTSTRSSRTTCCIRSTTTRSREAMKQETELFFDSIVREDRSVLDLLTADYSFVNERLAMHYGIPNITGNAFQRVTLPPYRRGLLGQGSILTLTSVADRTSPVQRGKWVMEVLLASPPPPPPPNVPVLDDSVKANDGGKMLSTRERMEEHRKNPSCTSCHRVIDPLGLALENFDVTGAWRIKDNEVPVDVVGDLYDGTQDGRPGRPARRAAEALRTCS